MKMRYILLTAMTAMLFLSGCYNRFEEYEPYSAFDERMAASQKGSFGQMVPDDQMPPPAIAENDNNEFTNNNVDAPRPSPQSNYTNGGAASSDLEVPFSNSRGSQTKHPYNFGSL